MRSILICIAVTFGWVQSASADIIFTLQQATPGAIPLGTNAVFEIYVRTDGAVINDNVGGLQFWIDANDPAGTGSEIAGGQFVSGTDPYFNTPAANASPYQFPFPTSLQVFSGFTSPGLDLGPTNVLLARITLSTAGATSGVYQMGLTNLAASDPNGFNLGVSNLSTSTINYAIVAVPEPASFGVMGLVLAGAAWRRRSKRLA